MNTDPNFGSTENDKSAMADSNAFHVIEPRDSDLENIVEKTWKVSFLTRKICGGFSVTVCDSADFVGWAARL